MAPVMPHTPPPPPPPVPPPPVPPPPVPPPPKAAVRGAQGDSSGLGDPLKSSSGIIGEWQSQGRVMTITEQEGRLLLTMGGSPALHVFGAACEMPWPARWAAVRDGSNPDLDAALYYLELASATSTTLQVMRPRDDGVVEFERVQQPPELAARTNGRPATARSRSRHRDSRRRAAPQRKSSAPGPPAPPRPSTAVAEGPPAAPAPPPPPPPRSQDKAGGAAGPGRRKKAALPRPTVKEELEAATTAGPSANPASVGNSTGGASKFRVRIERRVGDRLGIEVESGKESPDWDGKSILIRAVQADGLIPAWNAARPDKAVLARDRILEVNGLRGDATSILKECQAASVLELVLERRIAKHPQPSKARQTPKVESTSSAAVAASGSDGQTRPSSAAKTEQLPPPLPPGANLQQLAGSSAKAPFPSPAPRSKATPPTNRGSSSTEARETWEPTPASEAAHKVEAPWQSAHAAAPWQKMEDGDSWQAAQTAASGAIVGGGLRDDAAMEDAGSLHVAHTMDERAAGTEADTAAVDDAQGLEGSGDLPDLAESMRAEAEMKDWEGDYMKELEASFEATAELDVQLPPAESQTQADEAAEDAAEEAEDDVGTFDPLGSEEDAMTLDPHESAEEEFHEEEEDHEVQCAADAELPPWWPGEAEDTLAIAPGGSKRRIVRSASSSRAALATVSKDPVEVARRELDRVKTDVEESVQARLREADDRLQREKVERLRAAAKVLDRSIAAQLQEVERVLRQEAEVRILDAQRVVAEVEAAAAIVAAAKAAEALKSAKFPALTNTAWSTTGETAAMENSAGSTSWPLGADTAIANGAAGPSTRPSLGKAALAADSLEDKSSQPVAEQSVANSRPKSAPWPGLRETQTAKSSTPRARWAALPGPRAQLHIRNESVVDSSPKTTNVFPAGTAVASGLAEHTGEAEGWPATETGAGENWIANSSWAPADSADADNPPNSTGWSADMEAAGDESMEGAESWCPDAAELAGLDWHESWSSLPEGAAEPNVTGTPATEFDIDEPWHQLSAVEGVMEDNAANTSLPDGDTGPECSQDSAEWPSTADSVQLAPQAGPSSIHPSVADAPPAGPRMAPSRRPTVKVPGKTTQSIGQRLQVAAPTPKTISQAKPRQPPARPRFRSGGPARRTFKGHPGQRSMSYPAKGSRRTRPAESAAPGPAARLPQRRPKREASREWPPERRPNKEPGPKASATAEADTPRKRPVFTGPPKRVSTGPPKRVSTGPPKRRR